MARQTQPDSNLMQARSGQLRRIFPALISIVLLQAGTSFLMAESLASQNKKGNRLFAEGNYQDAERAYLEAEVKHPGRPEILYNLGNSQIKQKKYEKGIQTLRQSMDKGERNTKENSWYNTGNAYFLMGDYKNSSDAFIQALKLDPADKDAKHNLELALLKLKQQQVKSNQNKQNPEKAKQNPRSTDKKNQAGADSQSRNRSSGEQPRNSGSMTREQALQILDALKNQELQDQRMLLQNRPMQKSKTKDW